MQTPHTPGPWTVESDDGVDFTVLGGKSSQVRVAVECGERDARLIAAAPGLLAALTHARAMVFAMTGDDAACAPWNAMLPQIDAAIARATT